MPVAASAPTPHPEHGRSAGRSDSGSSAPDAPSDFGLRGLRAHLDRMLEIHGLRSLTVVVEDPDLGLQAFRAGTGPIESGAVAVGPGLASDPPLPATSMNGELLVSLCAASLRVEVLRESTAGDGLELALRRLPGVYSVTITHDGELTIARLLAVADAPSDLGRRAADTLALEPRLIVELVRDPPATSDTHDEEAAIGQATIGQATIPDSTTVHLAQRPSQDLIHPIPVAVPTPEPAPAPALAPAPAPAPPSEPVAELAIGTSPIPGATPTSAPAHHDVPELLSVRSVPEDGEIEVHLSVGPARAVGRALLARGLSGAAEAVLAGLSQLEPASRWDLSWIRIVETTADGTFVVAVALVDPEADTQRHGIGTGMSPIDAAAHATVNALGNA